VTLHTSAVLKDGDLKLADIWPDTDYDEAAGYIEEFLQQGYDRAAGVTVEADQDEAAKQWARHRAFQAAYTRLLLNPSTVEPKDEGSSSFLLTQIEHVGELAADALAAHQAIIDAALVIDEQFAGPRTSASVAVRFAF
jgi:hypothetical protein